MLGKLSIISGKTTSPGRCEPSGGSTRSVRLARATVLVACSLGLLFCSGSPAAAAVCPNEALREAQGVTELPECMALELASPSKKLLTPALRPSFSPDGSRVLFRSQAALGGTPGLQSLSGDRYVATRTSSGWDTSSTSPPASAEIVFGGSAVGGPVAFTPDLDSWVLLGSTESQRETGIARFYRGGLDGNISTASPLLVPIDTSGAQLLNEEVVNYRVGWTSTDLSTSVLELYLSTTSLLSGDPKGITEEEPGNDRNSYVLSGVGGDASVELLARDKNGTVYGGRCGAHPGGGEISAAAAPALNQGAISPDGSVIYFTTRPAQEFDPETGTGPVCDLANPLRIVKRVQTAEGPEITELVPGSPSATGNDLFQGASVDGTKIYFTSPRKLTASDGDINPEECSSELGHSTGCDLYLYDSTRPEGKQLVQVSRGATGDPTPGKGADVLSSITAISSDGTHAYFVAQGLLTNKPNPEGATAQAGQPNLYVYNTETTSLTFIATLAASDKEELWGTEHSFQGNAYTVPLFPSASGAGSGGDGHILFFATDAPVTKDDTDGGHRDVYRYDTEANTLQRISKAGPGGSDNGPFDVLVNPTHAQERTIQGNRGEQTRWASNDGETAVFMTGEALVPGDDDETENPYIWHAGTLARIAAKLGQTEVAPAEPPAVSASGEQFAFSTSTRLLGRDGDTAQDVYVAEADGGFPEPVEPESCSPLTETACQGALFAVPTPVVGGTNTFTGPGNPPHVTACKKGLVKVHGKCVKPPPKSRHKPTKHHHKAHQKKRPHRRTGGRK